MALRVLTGGGASSPVSPGGASGSGSANGWGRGTTTAGAAPGIGTAWPRSSPAAGRW